MQDKREGWRANANKERGRQRRYNKRLIDELLRMDYSDDKLKRFSEVKVVKAAYSKFKLR